MSCLSGAGLSTDDCDDDYGDDDDYSDDDDGMQGSLLVSVGAASSSLGARMGGSVYLYYL